MRWRRRAAPASPVEDRLGAINARARVQIEVAGRPFDDGGTLNWRDYKWKLRGRDVASRRVDETDAPVDEAFLKERHHRQYGRPWLLGRYAFDFAVGAGMQPSDRVVDIGCGALRFGIHAIRYLNSGCYFGLDPHLKSLEAAVTYELPLNGLEDKRPRLLWANRYDAGHFGETFDWAFDISTSLHVPEEDLPVLFQSAATALRSGGRLAVSPKLRIDVSPFGLRVVSDTVQACPLLEGHDFDADMPWVVLEKS